MDEADMSDKRIQDVIDDGIKRATRAIEEGAARRAPIIRWEGNKQIGICYYCRDDIEAGRLFCDPDEIQPEESCHIRFGYEERRKAEVGK